jgi:methyl-accepting chemotaxis protein WspA
MKTMTIWQRLHTTLAALIVLLLIGVGVAWWVENTRSKTQARNDQLMHVGDRLRRDILHLGDCLRWRTQPDPDQEQKKRMDVLRANITSTIEFLRADFAEYAPVRDGAKALGDYAAKLVEFYDEFPSLSEAGKSFGDYTAKVVDAYDESAKKPTRDDIASWTPQQQLAKQQKVLFDYFGKRVQDASTTELGKSPVAAFVGAGCLLVILVACVYLGKLQARAVDRPLSLLVEAQERMRRGDFTGKVSLDGRDEFGILGDGLNRLSHDLSAVVGQVQRSGIQVNTTVTEIAATAKEQQSTANEIAATTAQIGATSKEISATSKELVKTMNEVSVVAEETANLAGSGQSAIARMEATMRQIMEASSSISAKLAVLSEKTSNINSVVTTITKVADQTNLLSLNAAIEAEKAGEYGLGFAVVAMEIRRLADQTAVATYDIEKMVKEMQSAVAAGVMGMDKFSEEVRRGVEEIRQVSTQLAQIIHQVQTLTPRFQTVNEGMQSQATGAQQISETLTQLSEAAHQTAESLRQSNMAIEQLNEAARGLQAAVARFKLET